MKLIEFLLLAIIFTQLLIFFQNCGNFEKLADINNNLISIKYKLDN